jgi:hypothetical protein
MHQPHSYPRNPIRPSTEGRISITIGKVAVERSRDKARPCHLSGTEVIGENARGLRYARAEFRCEFSTTVFKFGDRLWLNEPLRRLMSVSIFRFSGLTGRRNHYGGEITVCGQLAEVREIMVLQIVPVAE